MERSRLITFDGPDAIVEAATATLADGVDLVLVRNLLPRRQARAMHRHPDRASAILAAAVPRLPEVDAVVAAWWAEHGYVDYQLASPHLNAGQAKQDGTPIHCDEDEFEDGSASPTLIYGPLSLSVSTSRSPSTFSAQRTEVHWFTEDRRYTPTGMTELIASEQLARAKAAGAVRTSAPFRLGDAALFATHPVPAMHGATSVRARSAQVFEYCLAHR